MRPISSMERFSGFRSNPKLMVYGPGDVLMPIKSTRVGEQPEMLQRANGCSMKKVTGEWKNPFLLLFPGSGMEMGGFHI